MEKQSTASDGLPQEVYVKIAGMIRLKAWITEQLKEDPEHGI